MRLDDERESTNFEIQEGRGGFGGGMGGGLGLLLPLIGSRFGCGGIVVVLIILAVMGVNPLSLMGGGGQMPQGSEVSRDTSKLSDIQHWSLKVLGSTERVWGPLFQQAGRQYQPTVLYFYSQSGVSGCGAAQSAMGPFYCPNDRKVYLDTDFFTELRQRFGAPGDFAQAYVIAHEVGHHVQDLEGTLGEVNQRQRAVSEEQGNALQVRVELQADCYAGVWAKRTGLMESGDLEEGMKAAQAIGDDTLQKAAGRRPVPESFTHGTSEQRMTWLRKGLDSGDPAQCDTFKGM
ncbi:MULTISPECIES: KPN_02809 family neutral zinc metallopeptidase [Sphingobium]|uniref:Flagellar biosynthesis protein FlgM n=1 Tax=Sphingobium fuliginis (strain ATCC 27551) TaxID=336203 RepID=A0ABQ1ENL6_SPHSA|nr:MULTISPECIES: neutral zinc metallopeptidase [Sphingobium]AJR22454.1 zinc metalloprotease [Sphingobium sp. YBL2]RYM00829.1 zinc metalloprotease [Sphingobium fuliginis]UXC89427.1 zinc metallopeptidase [Sphingobium sp. RSMS]WDA38314.1 zinc metallopeptidase [Sphingobium sp. YC-XJ3]GFZ80085.1 flagellar biosynthesis protein FlgM [Sphingobium fuliginis]